jgi:hypothetical protein
MEFCKKAMWDDSLSTMDFSEASLSRETEEPSADKGDGFTWTCSQ